MSELSFHREKGVPLAGGEDHRLATYINTDLQGSAELTQTVIERLLDPDYKGEINGNGHCLTITTRVATIESLFDEDMPARRLTREKLLVALQRWQAYLADATD